MTEAEKLRRQKRIEKESAKFDQRTYWHIAYHEAGHAVIAYRLDADVKEVYMVEKGVCAAVYAHPSLKVEDLLVITMAGDFAGKRFYSGFTFASGESDKQAIDMYLTKISYGTRRANRMHFRNAAKQMVDANWAAICRVATALMKHRRLTGDEVVAAIHSRARAPSVRSR